MRFLFNLLLESGGRVDVSNNKGETPLIIAAGLPLSLMALLHEHGGNLDYQAEHGYQFTAAHMAASTNNIATLRWLHEHDANMMLPDRDGDTPLDLAVNAGHEEAIEFLRGIMPAIRP